MSDEHTQDTPQDRFADNLPIWINGAPHWLYPEEIEAAGLISFSDGSYRLKPDARE